MSARYDAAVRDAERRWAQRARVCAEELVSNGSVVLSVDSGQVRGRVVRFWRGDSVLVLECLGPGLEPKGWSNTRLSRRHETDAVVIAGYLLHQVARLDDRLEPGH